nr:hypothetical protein [Tanacetum cinerariifolium]
MHRLSMWKDLIDRVKRRLSKWKMKMLPIGGRLTLVKSVLGSMPIFQLSLFKAPSGYSLWARVIKAIYGENGNIGSNCKGGSKTCWSSIVNEVKTLENKGIDLMQFLKIKIGNGIFTVASARQFIDGIISAGGDLKTSWNRFFPNKVNIHAWKVMMNGLATKYNMSRRGFSIDSITCVNCGTGVENTDHLFFTCVTAQKVSRLINRWWDIPDYEVVSYSSWKDLVSKLRISGKNKLMFEGVYYGSNDVRVGGWGGTGRSKEWEYLIPGGSNLSKIQVVTNRQCIYSIQFTSFHQQAGERISDIYGGKGNMRDGILQNIELGAVFKKLEIENVLKS